MLRTANHKPLKPNAQLKHVVHNTQRKAPGHKQNKKHAWGRIFASENRLNAALRDARSLTARAMARKKK